MAVRLKTHTKVLLAMAVSAITCAGVWHLGLRDVVQGADLPGGDPADPNAPNTPVAAKPAPSSGKGALGSAGNPLKVSIVSWHGYAPALVANGNSLTTKKGSIYDQEGVNVEFLLQDDIPTTVSLFEPGIAQCVWRTIDFFAQEHPQIRANKLDAKVVLVVDNSRGSDAILAKGDITKVEDLAGKSVGLAQYTPSHMVLVHAIEQSLLTERKKQTISYKFINGGTAEVRAAFESGSIDAAVLWEPDTSLALKNTPGSKVVYSTATATNLIYDTIVCDSRVIEANPDVIQRFVTGWLKGVDAAEADKAKATEALAATEPMFADLIKQQGAAFMASLYEGVKWTGLSDNLRVFGLAGEASSAEAIYGRADKIWRESTDAVQQDAPTIPPKEAFDLRFVQKLAEADAAAKEKAKQPEFTFTSTERDVAVKKKAPELTKPVSVNFGSGSAELSKRAQQTIDSEIVPLLDSMGSAYFSVEGNTDATGSAGTNQKVSLARAQAVVDYLVKEWEFPAERFKTAGNGPAKPFCNEKNPSADGMTLDECQAANRRTDVAVYSR